MTNHVAVLTPAEYARAEEFYGVRRGLSPALVLRGVRAILESRRAKEPTFLPDEDMRRIAGIIMKRDVRHDDLPAACGNREQRRVLASRLRVVRARLT